MFELLNLNKVSTILHAPVIALPTHHSSWALITIQRWNFFYEKKLKAQTLHTLDIFNISNPIIQTYLCQTFTTSVFFHLLYQSKQQWADQHDIVLNTKNISEKVDNENEFIKDHFRVVV